ncbi:hypothetical protein [Chloracidobacterium thermophilum]|uniref:hypothetical protein n=1 Tax=Chloracidobacterium thermophilum TaxID=458033 RepID=UPI000738C83A|nr:hypothetical protein [Chloracidobacterium thermophilum]
MKRPVQDPRTGRFTYAETPVPRLAPGGAVIRVSQCLLHAAATLAANERPAAPEARTGTETTALAPAAKPEAKPGLVRRMWSSFRQAGFKKAYETFVTRKVTLCTIEYGGSGVITAVAPRSGFQVGQRVAWVGYGQDLPAPLVFAATNRLVAIPEDVPDDLALLALPGGIAWRAVEAAEVRLGLPVGVGGQNLAGRLARGLCQLAGADLCDLDAAPPRAQRLPAFIVTDMTAAERLTPWLSSLAQPQARLIASLPMLPEAAWAACRAQEMQVRFTWFGGRGEQDPLATAAAPLASMEAFLRVATALPPPARPAIERHDFNAIDAAVQEMLRADTAPGRAVAVTYPATVEGSPAVRFDVGVARPKLSGMVGLAVIADTGQDALREIIPSRQVRVTGVVAPTPEKARQLVKTFDAEYGTNDVSPLCSDGKTDVVLLGRTGDAFRLTCEVLQGRLPLFLTQLPTDEESELEEVFRLAMAQDVPLMIGFARLTTPAFAEVKRLRTEAPSWLRYDFHATCPAPSAEATFRLAEAILLAMGFTDSVPERLYAQEVSHERLTTLALTLALAEGSSVHISATFGAEGPRERLAVQTPAGYLEREDLAPSPASQRAGFEVFLRELSEGQTPTFPVIRLQQAVRTALRIRDSLAFGTVIGLSAAG